MRRLNGEKLVEIEVDEGLQGVAGGSVAQGLGQRLEPLRILALQGDEFIDGIAPALMAAAAISRSPVADERRAGVARSIECLALGAGERLVALWLASCYDGTHDACRGGNPGSDGSKRGRQPRERWCSLALAIASVVLAVFAAITESDPNLRPITDASIGDLFYEFRKSKTVNALWPWPLLFRRGIGIGRQSRRHQQGGGSVRTCIG
jgi:hypothetical protein